MADRKQPANPFVDAELMEGVAKFQPLSGKQFQFYMISAITRLNTQMKSLLGNGRPGSIERLSTRLRKVELKCAANGLCVARRKRKSQRG